MGLGYGVTLYGAGVWCYTVWGWGTVLQCMGLTVTLLCSSNTHKTEVLYTYLIYINMSCVICVIASELNIYLFVL
jgi:hypothetical protein